MLSNDLLAGAAAAAEYAGITRSAIYHLVDSGALPAKKIGRRLYFRKSEIENVFAPPTQA